MMQIIEIMLVALPIIGFLWASFVVVSTADADGIFKLAVVILIVIGYATMVKILLDSSTARLECYKTDTVLNCIGNKL